jgi:hypothetical protein
VSLKCKFELDLQNESSLKIELLAYPFCNCMFYKQVLLSDVVIVDTLFLLASKTFILKLNK